MICPECKGGRVDPVSIFLGTPCKACDGTGEARLESALDTAKAEWARPCTHDIDMASQRCTGCGMTLEAIVDERLCSFAPVLRVKWSGNGEPNGQ